jgi:hypothetical protein
MSLFLLSCLAVLLVSLLCTKGASRSAAGRLVFPSWSFFNVPGEVPRLSYWVAGQGWTRISSYGDHGVREFFLNAVGNGQIAYRKMLVRFIEDVDSGVPAFESSVSYRLVENLVRSQLQGANIPFQFRVFVVNPETRQEEDVYVSYPLVSR